MLDGADVPSGSPPKLYILTREDLSSGAQATQSCHAAFLFSQIHPELTTRWHDESSYLILLSVPDERSLLDFRDEAKRRGLAFALVREPDFGDEATALALEPGPATSLLCANLPLTLRQEDAMI